MHQLIPIAGQKANPYNSQGRKNSLGDYVPSIYVRIYKEKKWFIQGEFRYGAPQYTKDIVFSRINKIDSSGMLNGFEQSRVQKTFYHQLPFSFNYYLAPNLSLGAGASYNRFSKAIIQQETGSASPSQVDSLISQNVVIQKKADSNFVTSYMQHSSKCNIVGDAFLLEAVTLLDYNLT